MADEVTNHSVLKRTLKFIGFGLLGLLLLIILLSMIVGDLWILEALWRLASGWIRHPAANLTAIDWDLPTLTLSALALSSGVYLLHRFLENSASKTWTLQRTIKCVAVFLATTAAAIAMTGIVHELAWLARSPITESSRGHNRTIAISNSKQIGLALLEMDAEGIHPKTMDEVAAHLEKFGWNSDILRNPTRESGVYEQFVLLQPGRELSALPSITPILVGFGYSRNRCVVLHADISAKLLTMEQLEAALDAHPEDG